MPLLPPATATGVARPRLARDVALVLAALALTFASGVWSVHVAPAGSAVAAWWPAAGISAALVALSPVRRWPALAVALVLVTGAANLASGREVLVSLCFGGADAAEAVLVALVLGAHRGRPRMVDTGDLRRLVIAALAGANLIGLLAGATVAGLVGGDMSFTWEKVFASHAAALVVFLPVVLLLADRPSWLRWNGGAPLGEALGQVAVTFGTFTYVFGRGQDLPLVYLCFPVLVWGALRLASWVVAMQILAVAYLVNYLTHAGGGPFIRPDALSPETSAALVQTFLVVCSVVTMLLTLALAQRRHAMADVTATGRELAEERDFTSAVLDSTDSLIVVTTRDGRLLRVNAAVERLSGLPGADLVGSSYGDALLAPCSAHDLRALVGEGPLTDPSRFPAEQAWRSTSGQARAVLTTCRALGSDDPDGPLVVTGQDVTSQRETQGLLRSILDSATGTPIIGTDLHGTVQFFNTGAEELLGHRSVDVVGRATAALFHLEEEVVARASELGVEPGFEVFVHEVRRTGAPEQRDWTYVRLDGSHVTVSLTVSARTDVDGQVHGYLGVARDITERRQAEESLRTALEHEQEAVARLHDLDRLKNDFVSTTSHELRTPLTSVLGYTQLLDSDATGPLTPQQRSLLGRIDRSGRRLLDLVENLLTVATLESARLELHPEELDLRDVVAHALETVDDLLALRDLALRRDLGSAPVPVWGDRAQLERVVVNLVSNAVKFTPDGGLVEVTVVVPAPGRALLRVRDSGAGIPLAEQDQVFTQFFRASTAVRDAVPGTGLGLSIVQAVVAAHDGTVGLTSEPGAGSTFEVDLPLRSAAREPRRPTATRA